MEERNTRIQWLDISKAIAIILMVVGHTSIPGVLSNFIWAFHMPLFFIASGWTTNWEKYGFVDFAIRKARTLLLPFAIYSVVVFNIQVFQGQNSWNGFVQHGWVAYALWFIPVLFVASLCAKGIYSIKISVLKRVGGKIYMCTLLCVMVGYLLSYRHLLLPWSLSSVPYATFMIVVGSEIKNIPNRFLQPRWYSILILFAITAVISHFYRLDMCFNSILPIVPITIGALAGTLMVFMMSMLIEKYSKVLTRVFVAIGKETYIILAFSQITIMLLNEYFHLNVAVKYAILVVVLIALKYAKDGVNRMLKTKLL